MSKRSLKLSDHLSLPLDIVTQKLAWLGVTGGGKTYAAMKLAELFHEAGAQFVVVDPVGVWYGLRLTKAGKPSDIAIPIFGGLHADVPLEPTGGALLADLVVDKNLSCILDVSQFESDAQKARFAGDFAARLFFRRKAAPAAMHLFLEECQEFVPQNPQRGEEHMLHTFVRMQKLGRNYGIGSSYISQRPQEVNKKALNMAQTLFVFRTTGVHERKAIESWIADKSLDESIANDLPKLATGDCHVWSPEFLKVSEVVHVLEKRTFDASAGAVFGVTTKARELAPVDLDQVRAAMAATIERAKADDPRELRRQIADLTKQAANYSKIIPAAEKTKEIAVLTDGDRELLAKLEDAIRDAVRFANESLVVAESRAERLAQTAIAEYLNTTRNVGLDVAKELATRLERVGVVKTLDKLTGISMPSRDTPTPHATGSRTPPAASQGRRVAPAAATGRPASLPPTEGVSGPEQRILDAIAEVQSSFGIDQPSSAMVAWLARYSPTSTSFTNPRSSLRTKGLIEVGDGTIWLTADGNLIARRPSAVISTQDLHDRTLAQLAGPERRILEPLLKAWPKALSNEEAAAAAGYSPTSTSYTNPRGHLASLGLIQYPLAGVVCACDILFPETR